jgi:hypothetical protein
MEKLGRLASEEHLLVVVDGFESDQSSPIGDDPWEALLGGLRHLHDTTVVSIARVSDDTVDVTMRLAGETVHCFTGSREAERLLREIHDRLQAATVYVGDGTHASRLEPALGRDDVSLTTWRPCGHDQAVSLDDIDKAQPILEMLYLLRRGREHVVDSRLATHP